MRYLKRVELWKQSISKACRAGQKNDLLDAFESENEALLRDVTDIGNDVEISFRAALADVLKSTKKEDVGNASSEVFQLLKFAFAFAVRFHTMSPLQMPKVPYLLIEDLLESQTIEKSESIWTIIDSMQDVITHPDLFQKGKLTLLRICNSLLRKLSKSCNTEFCGKVLMFLAAVYPLSEKSALNLSCKVNTSNITYFESAEQFAAHSGTSTAGNAGTEVKEDTDESAMDVAEPSDAHGNVASAQALTCDRYQAFWKLQSFFASEQKVIDSAELWRDFMQHARRVIGLFEENDFTDAELQQAHNHQDDTSLGAICTSATGTQVHGQGQGQRRGGAGVVGSGDDAGAHYSGCKYLTSSQLFTLQLRDPIVRQQIAVQILYFVHHLRTKSAVVASVAGVAAAEKVAGMDVDMLYLHDKACAIIERSPNDGARLLEVLRRLLGREKQFIAWKALGCPEIEIPRTVLSEEEAGKLAAADLHKATSNSFSLYKKRPIKLKVKRSAGRTAQQVEKLLSGYQFDFSDQHVKEVARELVKNIPSYDEEIQQYVDAEDPDAGIEEEYHPKKNNLYCWRARRLMAAQHLSAFEAMLDGDIGKGLRKLNNLPEPEPESPADPETTSTAAEADVVDADADTAEADAAEGTTEIGDEPVVSEGQDDNMAVIDETAASTTDAAPAETTVASTAAQTAAEKANQERKEKWRLERESIQNNAKRRKMATSNAKVDTVEEGEEQE